MVSVMILEFWALDSSALLSVTSSQNATPSIALHGRNVNFNNYHNTITITAFNIDTNYKLLATVAYNADEAKLPCNNNL